MSTVTCAISGILFHTSHLDSLSLPANEGFPHPIFAAPSKYLERAYSSHCRGKLTATDSYLLFMAYVHSSDAIDWQHPSTCRPNDPVTIKLVENNLAQLVAILHKTELIQHPSFKQPSFKVTYENANLKSLPNWIKAWEENISDFYSGRANLHELEELHQLEARLTKRILGGESAEEYSHIIADWAAKAGEFPKESCDLWKRTIRSCFNIDKMFNTPMDTLKAIKDHCECNIEVGSIHFHKLMEVIKEGMHRHLDYLGGSELALGYSLQLPPSDSSRSSLESLTSFPVGSERTKSLEESEADIAAIAATAPSEPPLRTAYSSNVDFLRAKLAFRVSRNAVKNSKLEAALKKEEPKLYEALTPLVNTINKKEV